MYSSDFEYYRPGTIAEAVQLLKTKENAKVLAGGHSLVPAMKLRVASPTALIDIGRIATLSGISTTDSMVHIGALTTHAAVAASSVVKTDCGLLAETAAQIGDQMVRNRGTLGGSLAHADPAADYPTAILCLGATLTAQGPNGSRQIKAADFFSGMFTTVLMPDEILTLISVPKYHKATGGAYVKHAHPASGYAVAGAAALVSLENGLVTQCSLVVGGCSPNPVRASAAEAALIGKAPTQENFAAAAATVAAAIGEPMDDNYASGAYRLNLGVVTARRALAGAALRAV